MSVSAAEPRLERVKTLFSSTRLPAITTSTKREERGENWEEKQGESGGWSSFRYVCHISIHLWVHSLVSFVACCLPLCFRLLPATHLFKVIIMFSQRVTANECVHSVYTSPSRSNSVWICVGVYILAGVWKESARVRGALTHTRTRAH